MLCRCLRALWFLVCLENHASWDFLDIGCDHWEILSTYFSNSLFSFLLKIIYLIFIFDVHWRFVKASGLLELELETGVSWHMGAGN